MIYLFTGMKGGEGKTTLSVVFSNFLYTSKKSNVLLLGFDYQQELSYLSKNANIEFSVKETTLLNFTKSELSQIEKQYDYVVIDCGFANIEEYKMLVSSSTVIVLPFSYNDLSFFKIAAFLKLFPLKQICLIPNNCGLRLLKSDTAIRINEIFKNKFEAYLLPPISFINTHELFAPSKSDYYKTKPTFIHLINFINHL